MLMLQTINPQAAPPAIGPFSHAVMTEGKLLFVSGQGPQDPASGAFRLGAFADEVRLTMANMATVLQDAGSDWDQVVRIGVYLTDTARFGEFNAIYSEILGAAKPARTTIICQLLAGIQVEMDCVARVP
jgi:2-iminobutanoate/2-iminopropanoate deaminase